MSEIYIWKSRLSKDAYPMADHTTYVAGDKDNLDPVVLGRWAALAKAYGVIIVVTNQGGYRSKSDQDELWEMYKAGKLQQTAAKPYTSRHGLALAVDSSTPPFRRASPTTPVILEAVLNRYGLWHPYTKEPWHAEPIETKGLTFAQIKARLAPIEMGAAFQQKYGLAEKTLKFISGFRWAPELVEKRMISEEPLHLSEQTIDYLKDYPYWPELKTKLNIAESARAQG